MESHARSRPSPKAPARQVVLSREELQRLFNELPDRYRLLTRLQYGAGLRLNELMRMIDFERGQIVVHAGKGNKGRLLAGVLLNSRI